MCKLLPLQSSVLLLRQIINSRRGYPNGFCYPMSISLELILRISAENSFSMTRIFNSTRKARGSNYKHTQEAQQNGDKKGAHASPLVSRTPHHPHNPHPLPRSRVCPLQSPSLLYPNQNLLYVPVSEDPAIKITKLLINSNSCKCATSPLSQYVALLDNTISILFQRHAFTQSRHLGKGNYPS